MQRRHPGGRVRLGHLDHPQHQWHELRRHQPLDLGMRGPPGAAGRRVGGQCWRPQRHGRGADGDRGRARFPLARPPDRHRGRATDRRAGGRRGQLTRRVGDAAVLGSAHDELRALGLAQIKQLEDVRLAIGDHDALLVRGQVGECLLDAVQPLGALLALDRGVVACWTAGWDAGIARPDLLVQDAQRQAARGDGAGGMQEEALGARVASGPRSCAPRAEVGAISVVSASSRTCSTGLSCSRCPVAALMLVRSAATLRCTLASRR